MQTNKRPLTVTLTSVFILLNALIWLVLGIIIAINVHPALPGDPAIKTVLAILSFSIAAILGLLVVFLQRKNQTAYYFTIAFLGFIAILTIFDDVGASDILVLLINLVPLALLIKDRKWYLTKRPSTNERVDDLVR